MAMLRKNYIKIRNHFLKILGGRCTYCGTQFNLELDHIIANGFGKGRGRDFRAWEWFDSYAEGNLQILCSKCNKKKENKKLR